MDRWLGVAQARGCVLWQLHLCEDREESNQEMHKQRSIILASQRNTKPHLPDDELDPIGSPADAEEQTC